MSWLKFETRLEFSNPFVDPLFIDYFDPVYNNAAYGAPEPPKPFLTTSDRRQQRSGFFLQDKIDFGEGWHVIGGVRYETISNNAFQTTNFPVGFPETSTDPLPDARERTTDEGSSAWVPRVGIVYEAIPGAFAAFASYGESFEQFLGTTADLTPLKPEHGRQLEAGVKLDFGGLHIEAVGFHIKKHNITISEPLDVFFFNQVGSARSQGAEVSAVGDINCNWSIISNYAYVDTRITEDIRPNLVGNRIRNIPLNTASIWSRHELLCTESSSLAAALGFVWVDGRPGDLQNSFVLPDYTRWDAGVYYQRNRFNIAAYFENLADVEYLLASDNAFSIQPGSPFAARCTVSWQF